MFCGRMGGCSEKTKHTFNLNWNLIIECLNNYAIISQATRSGGKEAVVVAVVAVAAAAAVD